MIRTGCDSDDISGISDFADSDYSSSDQTYETEPLCKTRKQTINPNDLIKTLGSDTYDFDKSFSQSIEVEVCENEGLSCTDYPMLKTKCKQRYLSIQLQVVSKKNKRSQLKAFSIPSNCECVFYRQ